MRIIGGVVLVVALLAAAVPIGAIQPVGEEPDAPPGWSAEEWAELSPEKREVLLGPYPTEDMDPTAKLREIATNPDPGPDLADLAAEAAERLADPVDLDSLMLGLSFGECQQHFPEDDFMCTSEWDDLRDGRHVKAYAGAYTSNGRGAIVVEVPRWPVEREEGPIFREYYSAPRNMAALTIDDASWPYLRFTSEDGERGVFDLDVREYR